MGGCQVHLWELYKKCREVPPDSQNVYFLESVSVKFHQDHYKEIREGTLRSRPPCRIIVSLQDNCVPNVTRPPMESSSIAAGGGGSEAIETQTNSVSCFCTVS